jgi:hypothetical protein
VASLVSRRSRANNAIEHGMNARLNGVVVGTAATAALAIALLLGSHPTRVGARAAASPIELVNESPRAAAPPGHSPQLPQVPLTVAPEALASLADRVERLARLDTPLDAFAAFGLLARCVRAREFDIYLKSLPMERDLDTQRTNYGDGQRLLQEACSDLSTAQLVERIGLVEKSARGGIPGAASAWIEQGPFGDKSALEQRPDDPLVADWVQQAIAWVKSAAKRDDIEAIAQFGMLSLNWELGDTERVKILVHAATQRDLEIQLQRLARSDAPRSEDGVRTHAN